MHWISIILIGIASNLDNLGIGFSFGMRAVTIPFFSNAVIAWFSMVATYLSVLFGKWIGHYIAPAIANVSGGMLIVLIGVLTLLAQFHQSSGKPQQAALGSADSKSPDSLNRASTDSVEAASKDTPAVREAAHRERSGNHTISVRETVTLGLALAINSMASGFGGGISGLSPIWTSVSVGAFSLLTVAFGVHAGQRIADSWLGRYSNLIGGLLLIAIGLYEAIV